MAFRAHFKNMLRWEQDRLALARSNARDICALRASAKTGPAPLAVILVHSQDPRAFVDNLAEDVLVFGGILEFNRRVSTEEEKAKTNQLPWTTQLD